VLLRAFVGEQRSGLPQLSALWAGRVDLRGQDGPGKFPRFPASLLVMLCLGLWPTLAVSVGQVWT
jgi:hypothetical protein